MIEKVIVREKGGDYQYVCMLVVNPVRWKCGRCGKGNLEAVVGAWCRVCKAIVVEVTTSTGRGEWIRERG